VRCGKGKCWICRYCHLVKPHWATYAFFSLGTYFTKLSKMFNMTSVAVLNLFQWLLWTTHCIFVVVQRSVLNFSLIHYLFLDLSQFFYFVSLHVNFLFTSPFESFGGCTPEFNFYPRDAMLARVFATATCLSVCLSVTRRYCVKTKKASDFFFKWFLHHLVAPRL